MERLMAVEDFKTEGEGIQIDVRVFQFGEYWDTQMQMVVPRVIKEALEPFKEFYRKSH